MTRVLVTGTDRPIGRAILPRLVRHDLTPVCAVGDLAGPVMVIDPDLIADGRIDVETDAHSSVRDALEGVSTVVHTADTSPGASRDIPDAVRSVASACADRSIHLILLSRVGSDISSLSHRRQLWQAEQVVEQTAGLGYTIQRITHTHDSVADLLQRAVLPLPAATPLQPVAANDIAGRIVGLVQVGPSQRVRDYGGPELMRFWDFARIYKQERGSIPRKVPLLKIGPVAEALSGVHVSETGDRGTQTFRSWLQTGA